mgnify:CR=1 FL=1
MKTLLITFCMLFLAFGAWAQQPAVRDSEPAAQVVKDSVSRARRDSGKALNKPATLPGYRIQVFSGNNRSLAIQTRTEVLEKFPAYAAYLIYKQPSFRVRVGDFRTRAAAQELLAELKVLYPVSFIVPDEVLENPVIVPIADPATDSTDVNRTDP